MTKNGQKSHSTKSPQKRVTRAGNAFFGVWAPRQAPQRPKNASPAPGEGQPGQEVKLGREPKVRPKYRKNVIFAPLLGQYDPSKKVGAPPASRCGLHPSESRFFGYLGQKPPFFDKFGPSTVQNRGYQRGGRGRKIYQIAPETRFSASGRPVKPPRGRKPRPQPRGRGSLDRR